MAPMATTKKQTTDDDVIGRLAGKGEQAINRLADLPGGTKALSMFNDLRNRVDELSRRMRGVDELRAACREAREGHRGAQASAEAGRAEGTGPQGRPIGSPARDADPEG